ncbi:coiled-coil domain-containing protein 18-like isoform X2 [Cylas formicarius]|uniref:coiled-coil domain-containing protein 18-like isoform X2 n=1 Tax=Cylas formicarius TaxID=197179 RepID=UPI002958C89E|nr:coiled-coil domain-containing protein 18-like isoform X2 [Cylas formicarius]
MLIVYEVKFSESKKSPDVPDELTFILWLIGQHYKNFEVKNQPSIHVSDLSRDDLLKITSLLMHYTCIHDRRNVLTSPLCYNLHPATQILIKSFLEKMDNNITNETLEKVILNIFAEVKKQTSYLDLSILSCATESPLQDVLQTPASKKFKLREKDKEIVKLRQDLELEKEEKSDLAEELQSLMEKNSKLETQLSQKRAEIKRLKSEVDNLENRTPPYHQDKDARSTQRLLKLEISNLEEYIEKCHHEEEELRREKDNLKDKLRKLQAECFMWQEKFINVEEKFEILSEHSTELESKNENLLAHCAELESLLGEFRSKSNNGSSLDDSASLERYYTRRSRNSLPMQLDEDLAHSVVDIQLKDVEKKLSDTLENLEFVLKEKNNLQHILQNITIEKETIEYDLKKSLCHCEEISNKNRQLEKEIQNIQSHKVLLEKYLSEETAWSDELNFFLADISKEYTNENLADEIKRLEEAVQQLKSTYCIFETTDDAKEKSKSAKKEILQNLQNIIKEKSKLILKLNALSRDLDKILKENDLLSKNLEQMRSTQAEELKIRNLDLNKFERCEMTRKDLENQMENIIAERNQLIKQIDKVSLDYGKLMKEKEQTALALKISENEKDQLNGEIKQLFVKYELSELEKTKLAICNENIQKENVLLIEETKKIMTDKEEITLNFQNLEKDKQELLAKVDYLSVALGKISNSKDVLLKNSEEMQVEYQTLEARLQKIVNKNAELLKKKDDLVCDLQSQLEKIILEKEGVNKKIKEISFDREKLTKEKQEIALTLQVSHKEKDRLNKEIKETHAKYELSVLENAKLKACNENLRKENVSLNEETKKLKKDTEEIALNFQNIVTDKQDLLAKVKKLSIDLDQMLNEKNLLLKNVEEMQLKCQNLESKLAETLIDKAELLKIKDDLLCDLENKLEEIIIEKEHVIKQIEEISSDREILKKEKQEIALTLQVSHREKDQLDKEIKETHAKYELSVLENAKLRACNVNLQKENVSLIEETKKLKTDTEEIAQSLQNIVTDKQDLLAKVEKLSFNLDQKSNEQNLLLKNFEEMQLKCYNLESKLAETLIDKAELLKIKEDLQNKLEKVIIEKEDIIKQIEELRNKSEIVRKEKEAIELIVQISQKEKDEFHKVMKETCTKYELSELEKTKLTVCNENLQKENVLLIEETNKLIADKETIALNFQNIATDKQELLAKVEKLQNKLEKIVSEKEQVLKENCERNKILQTLTKEKETILLSLKISQKETQKIKKERNEIIESQTKIMKETERNILRARENNLEEKNELLKRIEISEQGKYDLKQQLDKIQQTYAMAVTANSKYEMDNVNLRKVIEERNNQILASNQLKEAYEKLLEENSKYMTEVDTMKYKRTRDKEEFLNILKKEKADHESRQSKKIREVRTEYEEKLEKMKVKMLKLYQEELSKEMKKVKSDQDSTSYLYPTIEDLRSELFEAKRKIHMLEAQKEMFILREKCISRESIQMLSEEKSSFKQSMSSLRSMGKGNKVADWDTLSSTRSSISLKNSEHTRKNCTVTREQVVVQEGNSELSGRPREFIQEAVTVSRRTSIHSIGQNFEMEDEDDHLFNNKYLTDLKEGRCNVTDQQTKSGRMSELAWRNSMVPPHLKSSYPAELQFVSPTRFKEDDIKAGNIELDNSMCKLLPGEKTRPRKDFGTTTYKKPGPPTPSKNGGRLSLQGTEILPLREVNSGSKKVTPSRIKALFMGGRRESTQRENVENGTPRTKRLSNIFRNKKLKEPVPHNLFGP